MIISSIMGAVILVALVLAVVVIRFVTRLRVVVPANEVHTVQRTKSQISYGKDQDGGNTYYNWPSWIPGMGLTRVILPVSVFDLSLTNYDAYDKERVPFVVDVTSFFRINDPNKAAQRVASFSELNDQLTAVVQGAVRTVLASHEIDQIMTDRATFGDQFTLEVQEQLKNWGVETIKNIELMDIRDARDSRVIANIMAKRMSLIDMESRVQVANNRQKAEQAEIAAKQTVEIRRQESEQAIGQRTAEKEKAVGLAKEISTQEVLTSQRETTAREMGVTQVRETRQAEIAKEVAALNAEQAKQVSIINAEADRQKQVLAALGEKEQTELRAEGQLTAQKLLAEGVRAEGEARADAEKAMQLAPVEAQIVLAKEIGENQGYQTYLTNLRTIEANERVGVEGAKALQGADIKVISNAGDPKGGVNNVLDMFGTKGGTSIAGLLEGVAQSDLGASLIERFTTPSAK